MNNYWLSNLENWVTDYGDLPTKLSLKKQSETDDNEDQLSDRQKMMYDHYEMCVENHGKFDQTARSNGAHYAPANKNPFIKEGLVCSNCVFFRGGQNCEIVSGTIEPNAICKLWIIPEQLIEK